MLVNITAKCVPPLVKCSYTNNPECFLFGFAVKLYVSRCSEINPPSYLMECQCKNPFSLYRQSLGEMKT